MKHLSIVPFFNTWWAFVAGLTLLIIISNPIHAEGRAEKCVSFGRPTQFFDEVTTCVTSMLKSQGQNRYGPAQFNNKRGAWCEGMPGDGIGEIIRFSFTNSGSPSGFSIRNGYGKTNKTYRTNGRVASMLMSDDAGNFMDVYLEDRGNDQYIEVPWNRDNIDWIQFEISEVYRGSKYRDTCISSFGPSYEGG